MLDITDDALVQRYRGGDADAFGTLFDRHHAAVYNFALSMLRDVHEAEDAMQDVFVAAVRALPGYTPRGKFRYWLMRIARNRCLNRVESRRSQRVVPNDELLRIVPAVSPEPSPAASMARSDTRSVILNAIATLPVRQREAIALFAFDQMKYGEIAEVLDMPINTVKTLIHRARAALAATLDAFRKEQEL